MDFMDFVDSSSDSSDSDDSNRCDCVADNLTEFPRLQKIVPGNYRYAVCYYAEKFHGFLFDYEFRVNLTTMESSLKWIEDFKESSKLSFIEQNYYTKNADSHVFKLLLTFKANDRNPEIEYLKYFLTELLVTLERPDLPGNYEDRLIHEEGFPLNVFYRCSPAENFPGLDQYRGFDKFLFTSEPYQVAQQEEEDSIPDDLKDVFQLVTSLDQELRTVAMEKYGRCFQYNPGSTVPDIAAFRNFNLREEAERLRNIENDAENDEVGIFDASVLRDFSPIFRRLLRERPQNGVPIPDED